MVQGWGLLRLSIKEEAMSICGSRVNCHQVDINDGSHIRHPSLANIDVWLSQPVEFTSPLM